MSRLALLALCLILALPASGPTNAQSTLDVDLELVLAADGSGSIDNEELALQRAGYAAALSNPKVVNAIVGGFLGRIAVAFVEWGAPYSQEIIVDWTVIDGPESAKAFGDALISAPRAAEGYNSISAVIAFATNMIETNDYRGTRKIIDVSGDGPQINGPPLPLVRQNAVDKGITINGLVIDSPGGGYRGPLGEPLDMHYRNDVIGGVGPFVVVAQGREQFGEAVLKKIILEISGTQPRDPAFEQLAEGARCCRFITTD